MKNIYRILLTRATKRLEIYFMDDDTKKHVQQYLGIKRPLSFSSEVLFDTISIKEYLVLLLLGLTLGFT